MCMQLWSYIGLRFCSNCDSNCTYMCIWYKYIFTHIHVHVKCTFINYPVIVGLTGGFLKKGVFLKNISLLPCSNIKLNVSDGLQSIMKNVCLTQNFIMLCGFLCLPLINQHTFILCSYVHVHLYTCAFVHVHVYLYIIFYNRKKKLLVLDGHSYNKECTIQKC